MTGFASRLINSLFKKAPARQAAARRRAALGLEPLELRAVLSTVVPTTVADDVVVDGPIITGQDFDSARSGGGATVGGGQGAGKVAMRDFHFNRPASAARGHAGGVNVLLSDGSVRFISSSVAPPVTGLAHGSKAESATRAAGGGGGTGKVSMQDLGSVWSLEDKIDPADIIVGAGPAPGGHVKVFDGTRGAELGSFFAFQGFNGGVTVAAADISEGDDASASSHGTHVAGTIGSAPFGTSRTSVPTGNVRFFDHNLNAAGSTKSAVAAIDSGIDYSHPDLYMNVWINQLESIIDDLASDVARHS